MRINSLLALILLAQPHIALSESHLWRVRFVASSFTHVNNTNLNTKLATLSSSTGYDAVWEAKAEGNEFPTFFKTAKVRNATGKTEQTLKAGLGACSGDLVYDPSPSHQPGLNIYYRNRNVVGIRIATAHRASVSPGSALVHNDSSPSPCDVAAFRTYAEGEGVNTSAPPTITFPVDPTGSFDFANWAYFSVNSINPNTSKIFKYYQTANFPQFGETTTSVWFGFVTVERDPSPQTPPPVDPLKMFSYIPPDNSTPPPPPPDIIIGDPTLEKRWLKDPVERTIKDILKDLMKSLGLAPRTRAANTSYTFDASSSTVTIAGFSNTPASGILSLSGSVNGGKSQVIVKSASVNYGSSGPILFKLPSALKSALKKGKQFSFSLSGTFTPLIGKSATLTTKFTIPKRK